jgi:uncharacterized protein YegL
MPAENMPTIGGQMATRPLHFIWILDCSGSMQSDGKIQALNNAIREAIPHMQKEADQNPNAQVLVRAVRFAKGAKWHVAQPEPVETFRWTDVEAHGVTDMGQALQLVAEQLDLRNMPARALPPVLVLLSDGHPTDDLDAGLQALMCQPWGKKAVRMAIAIGQDADEACLQKFIGNPEVKPLRANNPEALVRHIRWVSTAVQKAASMPPSVPAEGSGAGNVYIPPPPPPDPAVGDVW